MFTLAQSMTVQLRGQVPTRIVLRYDATQFQPFFTHVECFPTDTDPLPNGAASYFDSGDYFGDVEEAVHSFGQRALRDLRRAIAQQREADAELADLEVLS